MNAARTQGWQQEGSRGFRAAAWGQAEGLATKVLVKSRRAFWRAVSSMGINSWGKQRESREMVSPRNGAGVGAAGGDPLINAPDTLPPLTGWGETFGSLQS